MNHEKEGHVLFGKFKLERILGAGGFGKVYLAQNLRTGQKVAIKSIKKTRLQEMKCGDDPVKTEISIMIALRHPSTVQLYEVMVSETAIYLVMEYVDGGTVYDRIRAAGSEAEHTARRYFQQLIMAVDFCHSRGIYHRDLKPDNLLLDSNGNLKICDFGMSSFQEQVGKDGLFYTCCGSASYVAPEVLSGLKHDGAKADIWACGVILYEIMTGNLPFGHGKDLRAMLKKMSRREYSCPEGFSRVVRELLSRLLDPNPNTRISIAEIMEIPWFKTGLEDNKSSWWASRNQQDDNNICTEDVDNLVDIGNPPCMNAFTLMDSWPTGLDLAPAFAGSRGVLRFMSNQPVSAIMSQFEKIAKANGFRFREKQYWRMNLEAQNILVEVRIFEVTPVLYAVDVRKMYGYTAEYENFRDQQIIPAIQEIAWAWQDPRCDEMIELKDGSKFPSIFKALGMLAFVTIVNACLHK